MMNRNTKRAAWTAVLVAAISLGGFAGAAVAAVPETDDMMPTPNSPGGCFQGSDAYANPCQTDNGDVSVWIGASVTSSSDIAAIHATLNGSYDPINSISISYPSSPVKTGAGETDIIYQKGTIAAGSGYVGYTWCDDPVDMSTVACDQQYVRFKTSTAVHRSLACHETGHAMGLVHGPSSYPAVLDNDVNALGCMVRPDSVVDSGPFASLGQTNVYWLNYTY